VPLTSALIAKVARTALRVRPHVSSVFQGNIIKSPKMFAKIARAGVIQKLGLPRSTYATLASPALLV
jgi:hypothetical protein